MNAQSVLGGGLALLGALVVITPASAQTPARSFADLQSTLRAGQQVIVQDESGVETAGRVLSLAGDQLEIGIPTGFFGRRQQRRLFGESAVRRIELVDSDTNGMLIGTAIGLLPCPAFAGDEGGAAACVAFAVLGMELGRRIDEDRRRQLYVSPQATRVAFIPLVARRQVGVAATIFF